MKKRFRLGLSDEPLSTFLTDLHPEENIADAAESITVAQDAHGGFLVVRVPLVLVEIVPGKPVPARSDTP